MAITKQITLYTFNELPTEEAKETARNWWRGCISVDDWSEYAIDEAKTLGFKITAFGIDRGSYVKADFIEPVEAIAQAIIREHGEGCDTHKTAKAFIDAMAALDTKYPLYGEDESPYDYEYENERGAIVADFKQAIKEDYFSILRAEYEYQNSDESIDETIELNAYTFREDGKREN